MRTRILVISTIIYAVIVASPRSLFAQAYAAIDLYSPTLLPSGFSSHGVSGGVGGGQLVGFGTNASGQHALLWTAPSGQVVDLSPTNISGFSSTWANATNGFQQVGHGFANGIINNNHALLWSGSSDTAVDLNPTNIDGIVRSNALATDGVHQVGVGFDSAIPNTISHALLWSGSSESVVDLSPTNLHGFDHSAAEGVYGNQQVGGGYGSATNGKSHALLWNGTADSAVDLHPINLSGSFEVSEAYGTSGHQQVGYCQNSASPSHALVWSGSAASAVDLTPTNLAGSIGTFAYSTNGTHQVGSGYGPATGGAPANHALLWSGTGDSTVDLHLLLPPGFTSSSANSIDEQGNVFGTAFNSAGVTHVVEWVPVPEPSAWLLVALGMICLKSIARRQHP